MLLHYVGVTANCNVMLEISQALPKVMHTIRRSFKQDDFIEYIVCPKCCTLYNLSDCITHAADGDISKLCTYIEFPNHPHASRHVPCGEVLLKRVKIGNKSKLVGRKVFIYRSIVQSLKDMAKRPGYLSRCNEWQGRSKEDTSFIGDIYDGEVWKDLNEIGGRPFLALPNNLCLSLNIDWFRLYEHSPYSAGAIYLVALNLPRNERFKEENVILAGIIPGPNEPKRINPFLSPLVDDLTLLYNGISFKNSSSFLGLTSIRATLACITCDLPATRKVCGFSNFNGTMGCSKCLKKFITPSFGNKPQYGGFDCDWTARDIDSHKQYASQYQTANTNSDQKKIMRESGVKYSELLRIPYFDIVRLHVIDPMHNIFLGLAKHTIKVWKEKGILQATHFVQLQQKMDTIIPPTKIGRIPRKLESNFSSFTADEWKNWILIYSVYSLNGVVNEPHYSCWCLLVDSCNLFCHFIVTKHKIDQAHILLVEFCKLFESLYGSESCTPNMHMACHIRENILDFGPLSAFWCFPFERYNGILEQISTSWMQPEKQMFLKFSQKQKLQFKGAELLGSGNEFVCSAVESTLTSTSINTTSVGQSSTLDLIVMQQIKGFTCGVSSIDAIKRDHHHLIPPVKEKFFNNAEQQYLCEMYKVLYPMMNITEVPRLYRECKKMTINYEEYTSSKARSQKSFAVAAKWAGVVGIDSRREVPLRIAQVTSYIEHKLTSLDTNKTHMLARVRWYGDHPRRSSLHSSVILCSTVLDPESCASFIPVSRIMCRCALSSSVSMKFDYGFDNVLVVVPLHKYFDLDD